MSLVQSKRVSVGVTVKAFKATEGKYTGQYTFNLTREDYLKLGEWFDENDHVKVAINPTATSGVCGEESKTPGRKFEMIDVSFNPWDKAKVEAWKLSIANKAKA